MVVTACIGDWLPWPLSQLCSSLALQPWEGVGSVQRSDEICGLLFINPSLLIVIKSERCLVKQEKECRES